MSDIDEHIPVQDIEITRRKIVTACLRRHIAECAGCFGERPEWVTTGHGCRPGARLKAAFDALPPDSTKLLTEFTDIPRLELPSAWPWYIWLVIICAIPALVWHWLMTKKEPIGT